jgi:chemotaxis protein methyltransferase CheR
MSSQQLENRPGAALRKGPTDFKFTDRDFRKIADIIGGHAGIVLSDIKKDLVYGRLTKRLRKLGLDSFEDYCRLIEFGNGEEFEHFINSLTTNLTGFYREAHHFEYLQKEVLPRLMASRSTPELRVWSAGCSTGAEPYSIAMAMAEVMPADWKLTILATDIDTGVLATAREGIYDFDWVSKSMDASRMRRWMMRGSGTHEDKVRIKDEIRSMVTFLPLNLQAGWPMRKSYDVIFCRNVVIYFDKATQAVLFDRMADQMSPNGFLFIGHSESLNKVTDRFRLIGKTIYQRVN